LNKPVRWSVTIGSSIILSLGLVAPAATAAGSGAASTSASAPASSALASASVPDISAYVPKDWQARRKAVADRAGLPPSPAQEAIERVINPDDYECGPTDFDVYIDQLLAGMSEDELNFLLTSGVLEFPTYDALLYGSDSDPRYRLGPNYRGPLNSTFRQVKRFWDIKSNDIQLHAMHGTMLLDTARVSRLLVSLYEFTEADAEAYAEVVADTIASTPAFNKGSNPMFTLNAFAFSGEGDPDPIVVGVPDKLIFGDGVLRALEFMNIAVVGPRAVLGHEFGHHIQYELNLFETGAGTPEGTRRTELMADTYATYFTTHERGLDFSKVRTMKAVKTFYEVGDCAFDDPGHHGTPNQRTRAAIYGTQLAEKKPTWRILPSQRVANLFDAKLPEIVAPDAP